MARLSSRPFPPYQFLPGKTLHPEKEGGYLYGHKLSFQKLKDDFLQNEDFCYSLDLMEANFFWEAHVYLEGLWNQVRKEKEKSDQAIFLQSLILLNAAGVKFLLQSFEAAQAHRQRALELISSVSHVPNFNLQKITKWMEDYDFKRPASFPLGPH